MKQTKFWILITLAAIASPSLEATSTHSGPKTKFSSRLRGLGRKLKIKKPHLPKAIGRHIQRPGVPDVTPGPPGLTRPGMPDTTPGLPMAARPGMPDTTPGLPMTARPGMPDTTPGLPGLATTDALDMAPEPLVLTAGDTPGQPGRLARAKQTAAKTIFVDEQDPSLGQKVLGKGGARVRKMVAGGLLTAGATAAAAPLLEKIKETSKDITGTAEEETEVKEAEGSALPAEALSDNETLALAAAQPMQLGAMTEQLKRIADSLEAIVAAMGQR